MKPLRAIALALVLGFPGGICLAQDSKPFSSVITSSEYDSAGLSKLTPEERAALDQLFEKYRSGAVAAAAAAEERAKAAEQRERDAAAANAAAQAAAAQAKNDAAQAKSDAAAAEAKAKAAASPSLLARAEALITPGTKIKYAPIEAHIVGSIKGWEAKTVFLLDNGQRWQVSDFSDYFNVKAVVNPKVTIRPARIAGFEMHIEGMGYMRVKLLSGPIYQESK